MKALESNEIDNLSGQIDVDWAIVASTSLQRLFKFADFNEALSFVNKVGEVAESQNHHPDIELGYGKVVVNITTHEADGLTSKDFDLAKAIEKIS